MPLQVTPGLPATQTEQLLSKLEGAEGLGPNQLLCLGPFAAGITRKMPLTVYFSHWKGEKSRIEVLIESVSEKDPYFIAGALLCPHVVKGKKTGFIRSL